MKVIILAAGVGSRLQPFTKNIPKPLIKIKNKEILGYQLDIFTKNGIKKFVIAVGAFKEKIITYVKNNYPRIKVEFVYNPLYKKTNYIYTLWLTKKFVDDDIILVHGDLIFEESLLERIIKSPTTSVLVGQGKKISEKDFKALIKDKRVIKIGVNLVGKNVYQCMPLYKFKQRDFLLWLEKIEEFVEKGLTNLYAEDALNEIIDEIKIYPTYYTEELCMEVDTMEDIKKVENLLYKRGA